jgi:hypothetical protein
MRGDGNSGPDTASGDPDKKIPAIHMGKPGYISAHFSPGARVKVAEQKSLKSRGKVVGKLLESCWKVA